MKKNLLCHSERSEEAQTPNKAKPNFEPGRMGNLLPMLLSTMFLLLQTAPSQAQTSDNQPPGTTRDVELPVTIVRGRPAPDPASVDYSDSFRIPMTAFEMPMMTSFISSELNLLQANQTIEDALWNSAGVTTGGGNGVNDFFIIRGIDSQTGGLVLIDRVPEPESTYYPLYNIESVQVLKGPGSFLFGPGSIAGSVNLVRKQPQYSNFGSLNVSYGSFDTFRQTLDINKGGPDQPMAFRLNALSEVSNGYRDGQSSEAYGINPAITWTGNNRDRYTVQLDYYRSRAKPDSGLPIFAGEVVDVPRTRSFQDSSDFSEQDVFRLQFDYERLISDSTTLRNKFYYTSFDWDTRGTIFAGIDIFGFGLVTTLSRFQPALDNEQQVVGNQLEWQHEFVDDGVAHTLLAGVELSRFSDEFTLDIPAFSDIDILTGATAANPFLPPQPSQAADVTTDWVGIYTIDKMILSDQWSLVLGGRVDWMDFDDDENDISRSDTLFSPLAGAVYSINPDLSWFVAGGIGHAPPSSIQRTDGAGKAEKSQQIETGLKFKSDANKLYGQLSFYQLEREDIPIATDATGILKGTGDQKSQGLEFELNTEPVEGLHLQVAYAYQDSELEKFSESLGGVVFDRDGQDVPFVPRHVVSLWGDYDLPNGWGIGTGIRHLSSQVIAPDNDVFEIDSYTVWDSALYYRQPRWEAALHILNMTNESYFTRAGPTNNSVIPGDGVAFLGDVKVKF